MQEAEAEEEEEEELAVVDFHVNLPQISVSARLQEERNCRYVSTRL